MAMIHGTAGHVCYCIQYYLIGSDIYFQSHLGLCKADVYSML